MPTAEPKSNESQGADAAFNRPAESGDGHASCLHWRFVSATLGTVVLLLVVIATANAVVDPAGEFGTRVIGAAPTNDRTVKLRLLSRTDSDVVILGNSRSWKFDPAQITQATGMTAFNASFSNGSLAEARIVATRVIAQSTQVNMGPGPHFVMGVAIDQFAQQEVAGATLLADGVPASLGIREQFQMWIDPLRTLTELETSRQTAAVLVGSVIGRAAKETAVREDGFVTHAYFDDVESGVRFDVLLGQQIEPYRHLFEKTDAAIEDGSLAPTAVREVTQLVDATRRAGGTLTLVLLPYHPALVAELDGTFTRLRSLTAQYLDEVAADSVVEFMDLSELQTYDGVSEEWYDGVHTQSSESRRMLDHVLARSEFLTSASIDWVETDRSHSPESAGSAANGRSS